MEVIRNDMTILELSIGWTKRIYTYDLNNSLKEDDKEKSKEGEDGELKFGML